MTSYPKFDEKSVDIDQQHLQNLKQQNIQRIIGDQKTDTQTQQQKSYPIM